MITFELEKDKKNLAKHGCSLDLANEIDWNNIYSFVDTRQNYGEMREIGFSIIKSRLYCVVYVQHENTIRIISLRKANDREVLHVQKSKNY